MKKRWKQVEENLSGYTISEYCMLALNTDTLLDIKTKAI